MAPPTSSARCTDRWPPDKDTQVAQNIYDDNTFFAGYSALPRSVHGLDGAPEWPALRSLLPPVAGARVLDLGCGMGWFCRWAAEQGAASVHGVDLSTNMLERARSMHDFGVISYQQADLDALKLSPASFDLVFSSLAFHYLTDLGRLWREASAALAPGGRFVFSVEHPMFTAPVALAGDGWLQLPGGRNAWPIDSYLLEGPRTRDWLAPGVIKQHRTMATYVSTLAGCGFEILELVEWGPTDEELAVRPELAEERDRPTFMLVSARKA